MPKFGWQLVQRPNNNGAQKEAGVITGLHKFDCLFIEL